MFIRELDTQAFWIFGKQLQEDKGDEGQRQRLLAKKGRKVKEADSYGRQIRPGGPKNK